ncbi:SAM-dependent methyltransferase [Streptomyces sp. NPDC001414]
MSEIDPSVPHSARIWNCWHGGKDNYPVDQAAGDAHTDVFPGIVDIARGSRDFMRRNIGYLVAEAGIRHLDRARSVVTRLMAALPSGSYLSVNDGSRGVDPDFERAQDAYNASGAVPYNLRSVGEISAFFDGLELVEPGVVSVTEWRPEPGSGIPVVVAEHGGLGRKR